MVSILGKAERVRVDEDSTVINSTITRVDTTVVSRPDPIAQIPVVVSPPPTTIISTPAPTILVAPSPVVVSAPVPVFVSAPAPAPAPVPTLSSELDDLSPVVTAPVDTVQPAGLTSSITASELVGKYTRLECVGKGGSSKVYKVLGQDKRVYAMKRVKAEKEEDMNLFLNEVKILESLKGNSVIIELVEWAVDTAAKEIYMVLEYGDTDLNRVLQRTAGIANSSACRHYFHQMLVAVNLIHQHRIVHGDLKPANFMMVEGILKLIDFGISLTVSEDVTSVMLDSQMGTLNYMSPETVQPEEDKESGARHTRSSSATDVWSLGCILYQMIYGQPPFAHEKKMINRMRAICTGQVKYAATTMPEAIDVIKACLVVDRKKRATIDQLLTMPFLDPSPALVRASSELSRAQDEITLLKSQLEAALAAAARSQLSAAPMPKPTGPLLTIGEDDSDDDEIDETVVIQAPRRPLAPITMQSENVRPATAPVKLPTKVSGSFLFTEEMLQERKNALNHVSPRVGKKSRQRDLTGESTIVRKLAEGLQQRSKAMHVSEPTTVTQIWRD